MATSIKSCVDNMDGDLSSNQSIVLSLSQLSKLVQKCPNDILRFIAANSFELASLLKENLTGLDLMTFSFIALGKACSTESNLRKHLNELLIILSSDMDSITLNIQRYLVSLHKQEVPDRYQLDALSNLSIYLKTLQLTLPSSSFHSISILLPLLVLTCDKAFKNEKELYIIISENLRVIRAEQNRFFEYHSLHEIKKQSENEKLHLQEPPENFRSLSILPTTDDVHLPCSFLRPNLVKGRYKDVEHYLDVQFRLLREDYIKPLRDGVAEYLRIKRQNKSLKSCKNVRVYSDVSVNSEEFVDGDLLHELSFPDKKFSAIEWKNSKRFLTGNLLCLSTDAFSTMLLATVIKREPKKLRKGLLLIKFEETCEKILNMNLSVNFVVIELPTLFEAYCHSLKVLQRLDDELLPMKNYIVDVEKTVNKPRYLLPTTTYDMRPLLIPMKERRINKRSYPFLKKKYPNIAFDLFESVAVTDDGRWPTALELNLDESQHLALKTAITKEFAIIQGPPGTGKTYIGLRTVQLLLHNIDCWFHKELNSLPILVVCYTNHALDQFLEGILMFTKSIVRIGGRGSNEHINKYQIKNLVQKARKNSYRPTRTNLSYNQSLSSKQKADEARRKIEKIKKQIDTFNRFFAQPTDQVFPENALKKYIPQVHFNSLKKESEKNDSVAGIYKWLEIKAFEKSPVEDNFDHDGCPDCTSSYSQEREIESEEEGDIEFIENQRNVQFYDFENRLTLKKNSRFNESKHNQELIQKQAEYIRNSLQNNPPMNESRVLRIKNIWMLPINERWQLYKVWLEEFLEEKTLEYLNLQQELKIAFKELSDARIEEDLQIIKEAYVVGMTTTGAAKYRHIIEAKNPVVLIVEEAAEILETHIITSLLPKTQHVILIGDQQQLRPSPAVHMLAVKYNMNISLFERMITNGMEYCRLSLQHRMRPEIASLIVPHIYPDLKNHEVVTKFENIKGVNKNVFFVSHSFNELLVKDSKSKVNDHEAKFIVKLCQYLCNQGYESSQITVLTAYSGQLMALKKLAVNPIVKEVRFTVVDNFQGEENDIILISFVRSNSDGEIGFLKISNRICVALSRAKKGLYCIGNFELLAQKSNLWRNILQTLSANESIGPSLRLLCQNHPDTVNEVAADSDFDAVPEGGCSRKCEYRLPCGHSCTLFCHPYDAPHEFFKCKKPCAKTCAEGHPCQNLCYKKCNPCPVIVEKRLSICGHTVKAPCGEDEIKIKCLLPCSRTCCEGHPCTKMCYSPCESCTVSVEKTLTRCGHTVSAPCGMPEHMIICEEACKKFCTEGHPCPKKCFVCCGFCKVMVDKILPRCGHTVNAACFESEDYIKCENPCTKSCVRNHPCKRKCYEICDSCEVVIEKTLTACGHTVKVACDKSEKETQCTFQCKKILSCSHHCGNKCYETCVTKCLQLVEIRSPACGHFVKVKCCFTSDSDELSKSCLEPCKAMLACRHKCRGTCRECGQENLHVACNEACEEFLHCGHKCTNKCHESCITKCQNIIQVQSPICGHSIKIECCDTYDRNKLSKKCTEPCTEILPCGHACKGTCGSCYQGRLHIACNEICEKILICGHKCESKCFISCPPCKKPCENRCKHGKCSKTCSETCIKCTKPCEWICVHKRCTRFCYELCNRGPCNKRCSKTLLCSHQCTGFCGEPCPKKCIICDGEVHSEIEPSTSMNTGIVGYVSLQDCGHDFKEHDLKKWLMNNPLGVQEIKMKSCPKCQTVIRENFRFCYLIKKGLRDIEKIKQMLKWDKLNNLNIQRNLMKQANLSPTNANIIYQPILKVLSGGAIRNIYELRNTENIMNIAREIQFQDYSAIVSKPLFETIVVYIRTSTERVADFIRCNFLSVSECQLHQLSREVYRLRLLDFLMKYAEQKYVAGLSLEFEECAQSLMNNKSLSPESVKYFEIFVKNISVSLNDVPTQNCFSLRIVSMCGIWYRCLKGHIICISRGEKTFPMTCYECNETINSVNKIKSNLTTDGSIQDSAKEVHLNERNSSDKSNVPDTKKKRRRIRKKHIEKVQSVPKNIKCMISTGKMSTYSSSNHISAFCTDNNERYTSLSRTTLRTSNDINKETTLSKDPRSYSRNNTVKVPVFTTKSCTSTVSSNDRTKNNLTTDENKHSSAMKMYSNENKTSTGCNLYGTKQKSRRFHKKYMKSNQLDPKSVEANISTGVKPTDNLNNLSSFAMDCDKQHVSLSLPVASTSSKTKEQTLSKDPRFHSRISTVKVAEIKSLIRRPTGVPGYFVPTTPKPYIGGRT